MTRYIIGIGNSLVEPISTVLGELEAENESDAKAMARTYFGPDTDEIYPGMCLQAFYIRSICGVPSADLYIPLKWTSKDHDNAGAISRDGDGIYLNAIRNLLLHQRMVAFQNVIPHRLKPNYGKGVKGQGSGTGYANHIRFNSLQEIPPYLAQIGLIHTGALEFNS